MSVFAHVKIWQLEWWYSLNLGNLRSFCKNLFISQYPWVTRLSTPVRSTVTELCCLSLAFGVTSSCWTQWARFLFLRESGKRLAGRVEAPLLFGGWSPAYWAELPPTQATQTPPHLTSLPLTITITITITITGHFQINVGMRLGNFRKLPDQS